MIIQYYIYIYIYEECFKSKDHFEVLSTVAVKQKPTCTVFYYDIITSCGYLIHDCHDVFQMGAIINNSTKCEDLCQILFC